VDFPKDVQDSDRQVSWALAQITNASGEMLTEAGFATAAEILDPALIQTAAAKIRSHILSQGDLRAEAVEKHLIKV
jgi:hypothetical protein